MSNKIEMSALKFVNQKSILEKAVSGESNLERSPGESEAKYFLRNSAWQIALVTFFSPDKSGKALMNLMTPYALVVDSDIRCGDIAMPHVPPRNVFHMAIDLAICAITKPRLELVAEVAGFDLWFNIGHLIRHFVVVKGVKEIDEDSAVKEFKGVLAAAAVVHLCLEGEMVRVPVEEIDAEDGEQYILFADPRVPEIKNEEVMEIHRSKP